MGWFQAEGALTGLPGNDAFILFLIFILLLLAFSNPPPKTSGLKAFAKK